MSCSVYLLLVCTEHLILNKQLMYFSLRKTIFPDSASLVASGSLCRVEASWAFPIHISMSIAFVLVQLVFVGIRVGETLWV